MKNVNERIAALSPDKQALLLQKLKQQINQPEVGSTVNETPVNKWVVRYRPNNQAHLRLFCFPYAGGGASIFRSWQDMLPAEVEVCGIQIPGRESRIGETAYTRIDPLLQELGEAILPYLDRPFAFYGHSMGSLISFELVRHLRRRYHKQPTCLYLAAYRAPQIPNPNIKIYHLPSEVFKVVLRADGISEMILQNEELMQAMLPTLRADLELCDTYEYRAEPPLSCPILLFGGKEDVRVKEEDLKLWPTHSSADCTLTMLPGSHFFLHSAQDLLLALISQSLHSQLQLSMPSESLHIQPIQR